METLKILPHDPMNSVSTYLRCFSSAKFRTFCVSSIDLSNTHEVLQRETSTKRVLKKSPRVGVTVSNAKLKDDWLDSLTFPVLDKVEEPSIVHESKDGGLEWIVGVDPDASGALALLKTDESGCTAQVFDSPHVQVLVGKNIRKRLDAKSIVQLLQSFDAPQGTTAYIEQSTPFPKDGKQGWWGGGFGYGMWIGILVASGYSVVPVPSASWKKHFNLSGSLFTKDDSRTAAGTLFPSLSSILRRKKDHGRAEALLIAAYGKGLKINTDPV